MLKTSDKRSMSCKSSVLVRGCNGHAAYYVLSTTRPLSACTRGHRSIHLLGHQATIVGMLRERKQLHLSPSEASWNLLTIDYKGGCPMPIRLEAVGRPSREAWKTCIKQRAVLETHGISAAWTNKGECLRLGCLAGTSRQGGQAVHERGRLHGG